MITLFKTSTGWNARFSGAAAETVEALFGTRTIPTAFTSQAPASDVQQFIAAQWPDCTVEVQ